MTNDSAENARRAQDVEAPAHHEREAKGTYHFGRGGEANRMTLGAEEQKKGTNGERKRSKGPSEMRRGSFQAAVDKGKEMLGMGKKDANSECAIADDEKP